MGFRTLIALGIGAAAGYYVYRLILQAQDNSEPQGTSAPEPWGEVDAIDEASWESFPASDAPAFNSARSFT